MKQWRDVDTRAITVDRQLAPSRSGSLNPTCDQLLASLQPHELEDVATQLYKRLPEPGEADWRELMQWVKTRQCDLIADMAQYLKDRGIAPYVELTVHNTQNTDSHDQFSWSSNSYDLRSWRHEHNSHNSHNTTSLYYAPTENSHNTVNSGNTVNHYHFYGNVNVTWDQSDRSSGRNTWNVLPDDDNDRPVLPARTRRSRSYNGPGLLVWWAALGFVCVFFLAPWGGLIFQFNPIVIAVAIGFGAFIFFGLGLGRR